MLTLLKHFIDDDNGAVTVDWVVLTAAVVGLALLLVGTLHDSSVGRLDALGQMLLARFFP